MRGLVELVVVPVEAKPWTLRVGEKVGKLRPGEDVSFAGTFPSSMGGEGAEEDAEKVEVFSKGSSTGSRRLVGRCLKRFIA